MRRFTSSELRLYQRCRRQWYLKHFLGYELKRDAGAVNASSIGSLYHVGIEAYYRFGSLQTALDAVTDAIELNAMDLEAAGRERSAVQVRSSGELVRIMLEGYHEWVETEGLDSDLEIVSAEEEIEVAMPESAGFEEVSLLGKCDLRAVRRTDGRRLILDSKTCTTAADQQLLAPLSQQFKHYALIELLRDGELVDGALIRWARRVKRTAKATPPFYGEVPVEYPRNVLRAYYRQTESLIRQILATEDMLRDGADTEQALCGPTVHRDCATMCVFRSVCPLMDDESTDVESVLQWSYSQGDPLARYQGTSDSEDAE